IALLSLGVERAGYDIVRDTWRQRWQGPSEFADRWRRAGHDGVIADSRFEPRQVPLQPDWAAALPQPMTGAGNSEAYELSLQLDPTILDGRFANNAWLQELPKPLTKVTWDNVALMSAATARDLNVG